MYRFRQLSRILVSTVLLFVVNSCAVLKLPPPGNDIKTILVLPFKVTDTTVIDHTRGYGFNYGYEIIGVDDENLKYEVIFALSNKEGILIVDSIPPGNYFVNELNVFPNNAGARTHNIKGIPRYDKFKLVPGKITIFPLSLDISVVEIPGGSSYSNKMSLVEWRQKDQIMKKLIELENFDKWEVLGMESYISLLDEQARELEELLDDPKINAEPDLSEQSLPGTDVSDTKISGTYYSQITGIFGFKANNSMFTIKQSGNNIVGTNDSKKDNDINGTREGDTIKFKYWTQWREYTGKLKISFDGTRFEGSFEDINGYGGKWVLTKIE